MTDEEVQKAILAIERLSLIGKSAIKLTHNAGEIKVVVTLPNSEEYVVYVGQEGIDFYNSYVFLENVVSALGAVIVQRIAEHREVLDRVINQAIQTKEFIDANL